MIMKKLIFTTMALAFAAAAGNFVLATDNPLHGKIIALDAGHGGGDTGATNVVNGITVTEADLNGDVVAALATKLTVRNAAVVIADRLSSRKDRVDDVLAKCAALDLNGDGTADGRKCDVLVSVHHNSASDPAHDGTLAIYNEKKDKPLAEKLLAALTPLTGRGEGLENGGYGMTVYGNLVSVITEAYYITNDCEAELYLYATGQLADTSQSCQDSGYALENRVDHEAQLQVDGLSNYFGSQTGGKGGRPR